MTDHEKAMNITNELWGVLQQIPGTLPQHQERAAAINFLRQRLEVLDQLQPAPEVDEPVVAKPVGAEEVDLEELEVEELDTEDDSSS